MKSTKYVVYCHLNQETGDVAHTKCSCKAGLGGCCKHVAAILNTLLDYSNLGLSYIPENTTVTQVLQKWNIPGKKLNSNVAVKFSDMLFEKSDFMRVMRITRKRPLVKGSREGCCATPIFAREVSSHAIKNLADALEEAGHATMLSETLKSNNYEPCHFLHPLLICQRW